MSRRLRSTAVLVALVLLAALPAYSGEMCPAPTASHTTAYLSQRPGCSAWTITDYFSDASHTTLVGRCTITCQQWANDLEPLPGDGATCSGATSNFSVDGYIFCPCPP
jgi:hypothetical protein